MFIDPVNPSNGDLPLQGMRVIELSHGRAEMCARLLADLGAEVILIEPPGGLPARQVQPLYDGVSLHFATHHANKRSVTLDLESEQGRTGLHALLRGADLFVESSRPGWLVSRGLEQSELRRIHPRLLILSITDFGHTGPWRDHVATNAVHLAMAAVLARSGIEGNRPLLPPGNLAWETTAVQAAWVALLACWQRSRNGRGNWLDFSIFEATAQVIDPALGVTGSGAAGRGAVELAPHGRPPVGKLYPIFACADGHVRICVLNPRQWRGMRDWLGSDHAFTDPRFDRLPERIGVMRDINALIARLFAHSSREELVREGQRRGVPIAAVATPAQVLDDAQLHARGAFRDLDLGPGKLGRVPSGYLEIDGRRMGIRTVAPEPGQHTDEVHSEIGRTDQASPEPGPLDRRPLAGIRVLDLGVIVAGAEVGRLFADQGADVIKIENSAFPDGLRQGMADVLVSQSFAQGSRNKRSFGLNLRNAEGITIFKRMVAQSDVVLSNFKPGTLESLGIGYQELREINPRIVLAESSALGNTGPLAQSMGYGPLVRASCGLTGLWRYPEIESSYSDSITIFPDHFAARVAAVGVLAALMRRERSGEGAQVVVSQAECILNALATEFLRESLQPGTLVPHGNQYEFDAPNNVFPCAGDDMWCVIAVRNDEDWRKLLTVIDREELRDAGYANSAMRVDHRAEIEGYVAEWTASRSPLEIMELLQAAGVPAGHMQRLEDFATIAQLRERGFFRHFDQPGYPPGRLQTQNGPIGASDLPEPQIRPAPLQGQHTREIARDVLGLGDEDIEALVARGVLEDISEEHRAIVYGA